MSVIASCGHELTKEEDFGIGCAIMDYARDGKRAISYPSVCDKCFERYDKIGLLIETDKQKDDWLKGKTAYPSTDYDEDFGYPELKNKPSIELKDNVGHDKIPPVSIDKDKHTITISIPVRESTKEEEEFEQFRKFCKVIGGFDGADIFKQMVENDSPILVNAKVYLNKIKS